MKISVVIPARNEEQHLPACLSSIREAEKVANCTCEILVVLNRCNDATEQIARSAGCITVRQDAKNLSVIRNAGAQAATGEILIFIDADSRMHSGTLRVVLEKMSLDNVIGGGTLIMPERYSLGIVLTTACLLPFVILDRISGGLFFVRKKDFEMIGGFNPEFLTVEDIDFARRLKAYGKESGRKFVTLWWHPITTSMRKFDEFGDWYFLRHPKEFMALFGGKNKKLADKIWYDFEH